MHVTNHFIGKSLPLAEILRGLWGRILMRQATSSAVNFEMAFLRPGLNLSGARLGRLRVATNPCNLITAITDGYSVLTVQVPAAVTFTYANSSALLLTYLPEPP